MVKGFRKLIEVKAGQSKASLVLRNAKVVNVFTGEVVETDVSVVDGIILGLFAVEAEQEIDLKGQYLLPGFIDAHVHPESGMLEPGKWSQELVPLGTTAVIADPHEIANVLGKDGIKFMVERTEELPLRFFFMLPSCVPATHLETAGAKLDVNDLAELASLSRVIGLAEMMNFPGVINGFEDVLAKLEWAEQEGLLIDGHAPTLSGQDLALYRAAGILTDHECITAQEATEKVASGMKVLIREGSAARNLEHLLPAVKPENWHRFMFCTDDRQPLDLEERGHINQVLRKAVSLGLDAITAIRMATIVPAEHYRLSRIGAIAPGYYADLVVCKDLERFEPSMVFVEGKLAAKNGNPTFAIPPLKGSAPNRFSIPELSERDFVLFASGSKGPVIETIAGQIFTKRVEVELRKEGDVVLPDVERDLLKLIVIERYTGKGGRAGALVRGFGLTRGAIATTVAHDSHNLIIVGADDRSMATAAKAIASVGGGLAVADGDAVELLPLPVAGLMSVDDGNTVRQKLRTLLEFATSLGCVMKEPFMQLSFLALPVIPELKLTDKGLVDVTKFEFVDFYRMED